MHYVKDTAKLMVKFVRKSDDNIILEIPSTQLEVHEFLKADYVTSVLTNTFGRDKLKSIGDFTLIIDQNYLLQN